MGVLADPFQLDGFVIDGKYRVATVVGDGGFGVVYRGVHKGFGELIAVKCLKLPGELEESEREALLEQLREEGRLLHRLSKVTSGIVQALDVGAFVAPNGRWVPYLVLEWLEGEPLSSFMRRRERGEGGLSAEEARDLLAPAARALAIAHEQKVAHRDVKPANLFVTDVGGRKSIKVLDFGIAKVLSEHHSKTGMFEATGTAPTAFTPRYGAPEQFNKKRGASGPWTDVFALALIYVELIIAKRALEGDDPTQLYVASADVSSRPTLRSRGAECSDAVEAVLAKALAVEPRERWPDVGAFWDALEAAIGGPSTAEGRTSRTNEGASDRRSDPAGATVREAAAFGPTIPVESLPRSSDPKEKDKPKAADVTRPPPVTDPMEETPAGARAGGGLAERTAASAATSLPRAERGKPGGFPWGGAAVAIFVVGVGFAYFTWSGATSVEPSARPSASAAPSARKAPGPKASARPKASASASAAPSASGSAAPATTPPRFVTTEGMVRVAAATFAMGEGTSTQVTKDFWIDGQEVTLRSYRTCDEGCGPVAEASSAFTDWTAKCNASRDALDEPVNCVDWSSARNHCAQKGKRLPTEAEWELAARSANGRFFPWGSREPTCATVCADRNGDCAAQGVSTCAPGSQPTDRTPEGIWDLGGNVAEWVADGFADALPGGSDPLVATAARRVVRGGSFATPLAEVRTTSRTGHDPATRHAAIGFRCAVDAALTEAPPPP